MKQKYIREHTCCFFGHRKIHETDLLKNTIYNTVEDLIVTKKVNTFLFGSKSQFDALCYKVVTDLRVKYPHIRRIYVRAEFPCIDDYKKYLLYRYEDTYYSERLLNAGKAIYIERNYDMIDKSKYCVVYCDDNYVPPRRKNTKRELTNYQPRSGTKLACDYAKRKGLNVNNVAAFIL